MTWLPHSIARNGWPYAVWEKKSSRTKVRCSSMTLPTAICRGKSPSRLRRISDAAATCRHTRPAKTRSGIEGIKNVRRLCALMPTRSVFSNDRRHTATDEQQCARLRDRRWIEGARPTRRVRVVIHRWSERVPRSFGSEWAGRERIAQWRGAIVRKQHIVQRRHNIIRRNRFGLTLARRRRTFQRYRRASATRKRFCAEGRDAARPTDAGKWSVRKQP